MLTFNKTLEAIMQMDYDSREMLLEIIRKRQIEERRNEIAENAKEVITSFKKGKFKSFSAATAIKQLNKN